MRFTPSTLFRTRKVRSASPSAPGGSNRGQHRPARYTPRVEGLELRDMPSTITVINPLDSGPGSLRDALARAADGDLINFSDRLMGQPIRLTSGELAVTKRIDIEGLGESSLTISGTNSSRVFHVAAGTTVSITGVTITQGQAATGGGIDNAGNLTVRDSTLAGNQAVGGDGGGAILNRAGATLTLAGDLLTGNRATAAAMKDVFGGALLNKGTAAVTASTFRGNQALGGGSSSFFAGSVGGAIDNFGGHTGGAQLTVDDSIFINNQAVSAAGPYGGSGGAIENNSGPNQRHSSTAVIRNSTFMDNLATGGDGATGNGGALVNEGMGAAMTVSGCTLTGNRSVGGPGGDGETTLSQGIGGGILNAFPGATLMVTDSAFLNNQARGGDRATITADNPLTGGGLGGGLENAAGGTATVLSSTFSGNQARGGAAAGFGPGGSGVGGAIQNSNSLPPSPRAMLTIMDSMLIGNQALGGQGGGGASTFPGGLGVGGAIDDSFFSDAVITHCMLIANQAIGGHGEQHGGDGLGGGIAVGFNALLGFTDQSTVQVSGSTIDGNVAGGGSGSETGPSGDGLGGGLAIIAGSSATVSASTIEENHALGGAAAGNGLGLGGGVYNLGMFTFDDLTTIRRNRASTSGDDIYP